MSNDRAALADFCASKATQAAPEQRESWAFMQMLFENDSRRYRAAPLWRNSSVAAHFLAVMPGHRQHSGSCLACSAFPEQHLQLFHLWYCSSFSVSARIYDAKETLNGHCSMTLRRHLLEHLGFQDIMPQADGAGEDASLAAHADALQLTSPRSAPGTSPPQHMPEANGNAFKEEGIHPPTLLDCCIYLSASKLPFEIECQCCSQTWCNRHSFCPCIFCP